MSAVCYLHAWYCLVCVVVVSLLNVSRVALCRVVLLALASPASPTTHVLSHTQGLGDSRGRVSDVEVACRARARSVASNDGGGHGTHLSRELLASLAPLPPFPTLHLPTTSHTHTHTHTYTHTHTHTHTHTYTHIHTHIHTYIHTDRHTHIHTHTHTHMNTYRHTRSLTGVAR
jgi:hypothetical protein